MKGYDDPVVSNGNAAVGGSMVAIDNIRLDAVLGSGANGFVFSGHDLLLDRRVAVKVYPPRLDRPDRNADRIEQAMAEARKLASMKTDVIASVYYVGRIDNEWPYVVMEYIEGDSLASVRDNLNDADGLLLRKFSWDQVYKGLDTAERLGIYHGDLHGGNVIFRPFGATLIDFGTSALAGKDYSLRRHATMVNKFARWLLPELQDYVPPFDIPNLVRPEYATVAVGSWVRAAWELRQLEARLSGGISDEDLARHLTSMAGGCSSALIDIDGPVLAWLERRGVASEPLSAYRIAANAEVARMKHTPYPPTIGSPARPVPPWPSPQGGPRTD
jgi:serine/threonine protein kinase